MLCVQFTAGQLIPVDPQPADFSACTLVLQSGAEVGTSPFSLSVEDAALIGSAIVLVWGFAWGFKALILTLKGGSHHETTD